WADSVVSELGSVAHEGSVDVAGCNSAILRDDEFDDDGETVGVLVERCEVGRQRFRQHGESACSGVDAGGFGSSMFVDRGIDGDIGVDISYGDQNTDAAADALSNFGLIEIARGVVIDGGPQQRAEITNIAL